MSTGIINGNDTQLLKAIIGIFVQRSGGRAILTQEDFDQIAGFVVAEDWLNPGAFRLTLTVPSDPRLPNPKETVQ